VKTASIIFYLLQFTSTKIKISLMVLRLIFVALEGLFCLIVIFIFGTFGTMIYLTRMHEQKLIRELRTRRNSDLPNRPRIRQSRADKEIIMVS